MNQTLNFLENVVNTVCNVDIRKVDRHRPYVIARTIYYGLAKIYTDCSLKSIGEHIGRNHATVLHSLNNLEMDIIKNPDVSLQRKWEKALFMVDDFFKNEDELTKIELKEKIQKLIMHNEHLKNKIDELNNVSLPDNEKEIINLFRSLNEEDKIGLKVKAELMIKFRNNERKREEEIKSTRSTRFSSYLADAEV